MNNRIGYVLSSEEHSAPDLVRNAGRAEEAGFSTALISDHFHPWTDLQGNSPFVWGVLGAIAQHTENLKVGTGVTCPTMRMHPAIIAHAAATAATLMPGRFFLGVGTGENLNEHVLGGQWPAPDVRLEMLEEAVEVMRLLWEAGEQTHRGKHYVVEDAQIYNLPDELPPIIVGASGSGSTDFAARSADGLIATSPDRDQIARFRSSGGAGKPAYGKLTVSWANTESEARAAALRYWPNAAMASYALDLRTPRHFQEVADLVREEDIAEAVLCSADPAEHVAGLTEFFDAGFDLVFVHQVGPDQEAFLRFCQREVLPAFAKEPITATAGGGTNAH